MSFLYRLVLQVQPLGEPVTNPLREIRRWNDIPSSPEYPLRYLRALVDRAVSKAKERRGIEVRRVTPGV